MLQNLYNVPTEKELGSSNNFKYAQICLAHNHFLNQNTNI